MDVASFCRESRVLVVAGKGGVGKTTVTAGLAAMAASVGLSVLVVELEGRSGIQHAFGAPEALEYSEVQLSDMGGGVRARRITPDDALLEYLATHGLQRVSKRLVSSGVIDVVATAIPGIRDVLVLGKVKSLELDRVADLILVDAPATGHAVTFLTSASGLLDVARGGPVRSQAAGVVELLQDPSRCRVVLVTLPEEMPVSETIEAAYLVEDKAGVQLGPVVINAFDEPDDGLVLSAPSAAATAGVELSAGRLAEIEAAREFRLHRQGLQAEQVARLGRELPLPQLRVPILDHPAIGLAQLRTIADALAKGVGQLGMAHGPVGDQ
jgi:anion-transporting  ArsA/GET3 family ATPase